MRKSLTVAVSALALHASGALAQVNATGAAAQGGASGDRTATSATPTDPASSQTTPTAPRDIVVTARRLDDARSTIQPSLGATSYTITNATIQALPGGDNQQFNQVILQLPGVVQDGLGQFHVRDDHNNLQYRINGVILPEGIAVFGQTLSPRIVERFSLLTGALPAQYGLRSAGIIDITTKSGVFNNGGSASIYGGSQNTVEPSVEYGGHSGNTNFFVTGDYRRNDRGIEGVDASRVPLHDHSDQYQAFAYADHIIDDDNRVSFVGGYSNQYFQIPNPRGLQPDGTYSVGGRTNFLSDSLNERQVEKTAFGQVALLHHGGALTYQASAFARYSALQYRPDPLGELLFNGQAQDASKHDFTFGGQFDAAYRLGGGNTVRGGVIVTRDHGTTRTATTVFALSPDTHAQVGQPFTIADSSGTTETTESVYLQDELKLSRVLTLNAGARFDHYSGFRAESGFSPRANLVFQSGGTTIHGGYARYFSPPPFELVASNSIAKFTGTSAGATPDASGNVPNTTPFAERQDYFDVGVQQKLGALTVGADGYHRRSRNLIDEGQFGAPIVLTPFNYANGRIDGVEFNTSYAKRGLLVYGNFAYAKAQGTRITSSQFNIDPGNLAYIQTHYIYLDHDQTYTASGGVSYGFQGGLKGLKLATDALYGSGLRTTTADAVPNGHHLPGYAQINLSASYLLARPGVTVRFDVINVGDHVYEIRDGSGVGVGAPQYGPRRGFFGGISKAF